MTTLLGTGTVSLDSSGTEEFWPTRLPPGFSVKFTDMGRAGVYWHLYADEERINGGLAVNYAIADMASYHSAWFSRALIAREKDHRLLPGGLDVEYASRAETYRNWVLEGE